MEFKEIVSVIILAVVGIAAIAYLVINRKTNVIEWLEYMVTEAEKILGGGTGQAKLRLVYAWFTDAYPFLASILPFSVFSAWVDDALKTMNEWLKNNENIKKYVEEGKDGKNKSN